MWFFYIGLANIFATNVVLLALLTWAHQSPRFAAHRISSKPGMKVAPAERLRTMMLIGTLSLVIVVGGTYALQTQLIRSGPTPWWRVLVDALLVLVLYDFLYYALHRTLHHKKLMRFVHGVHHRARNPSALESFFQHPFELALGLGLLLFCSWIVGPMSVWSFFIAFFVYSNLNIIIHSGLALPGLLMWPTTLITKKHHVHHQDDFSKNFASLTPLPDLIFGTLG